MGNGYTEVPENLSELLPLVLSDKKRIAEEIFRDRTCWFYDACSFRRHAQLSNATAEALFTYIKENGGSVIITRSILMELASGNGIINCGYIDYVRRIRNAGIDVLLMYEEDLLSVMEICFGAIRTINEYLCWTVRMMKKPVSTITETLERDDKLKNELIKGKNLEHRDIFPRFFQRVRAGKTAGDNLGEELLAICLHILAHVPGEPDGKFRVITDDKAAAGEIDNLFQKTARQYCGKRIVIYSTPRLVQILYRAGFLREEKEVREMLQMGISGNITVFGVSMFDIRSRDIKMSSDELTTLIMRPDGIDVIF